jgi:prophage regulatory protein
MNASSSTLQPRREGGVESKPILYVLRLREVLRRVALSKSSVYAMIGCGRFPPPIQLGVRSVGWPEHVIEAWIAARISQAEIRAKGARR